MHAVGVTGKRRLIAFAAAALALAVIALISLGPVIGNGSSEDASGTPATITARTSATPDARKQNEPTVRVATTGNHSEVIDRVPIGTAPDQERRVIMSMGPETLPDFAEGDLLRLSSESQVTLNCNEKSPRCVGPIYTYDPLVSVRLVMTSAPDLTYGIQIGPTMTASCQNHRPREHHCVETISGADLVVPNSEELPCPINACYINLVLDASNPEADRDDLLLIGGNRPSGAIPQDRGRINAIVFHPAAADSVQPTTTRRRSLKELPLDFDRHVVYSQKLTNLTAGEQLAVSATAITDRTGLPYSVRTSSQLILARSPREVEPGRFAQTLGGRGEIDESNGFNCTRDRDRCTTRKLGVLRIRRDAQIGGRPAPVYVNLVMIVGPKRFEAEDGDRYDVLRHGGLSVTRYPQPTTGDD